MKPIDRRGRKKERTRQVLLDVALRLIADRGIYGTRIEDITERADLGKGAFYNYFESKDQLIAELVSRGVDLLHERYLTELPASASQAERIQLVIVAHETFFADHPVFVVLLHQARGLAQMRATEQDALTKVFVEYLRRISSAIVSPTEHAHYNDADLLDFAAVILGAIAGYRSFRLAAGLGVSSPIVAEVLASGLPATLAIRGSKPLP